MQWPRDLVEPRDLDKYPLVPFTFSVNVSLPRLSTVGCNTTVNGRGDTANLQFTASAGTCNNNNNNISVGGDRRRRRRKKHHTTNKRQSVQGSFVSVSVLRMLVVVFLCCCGCCRCCGSSSFDSRDANISIRSRTPRRLRFAFRILSTRDSTPKSPATKTKG